MNDYTEKAIEIMENPLMNGIEKREAMERLISELRPEEAEEMKEAENKSRHWPGMYRPEEESRYREYVLEEDEWEDAVNKVTSHTERGRAFLLVAETEKEAEFVKAHLEARRDLIDRIQELNEG